MGLEENGVYINLSPSWGELFRHSINGEGNIIRFKKIKKQRTIILTWKYAERKYRLYYMRQEILLKYENYYDWMYWELA